VKGSILVWQLQLVQPQHSFSNIKAVLGGACDLQMVHQQNNGSKQYRLIW
jgi:hypothetical protein